MIEYYDKKIESMSQDEIKKLQLELFNRQLKQASKAKAYKGKLPEKINDLSEIQKLPFTSKIDLRENFPYGFLAVPESKISRFNATSGTTGIPTLVYFTESDINNITERAIRQFTMAGLKKGEIVQTMLENNLFVGGWYHNNASLKMGLTVLPSGTGNTERQIRLLKSLKPKYCFSTSAYFLHVLNTLSEEELKELSFQKCIIGAEPTSMEARKIIKEKYHVEVYDLYGFTEAGGPFAQDCPFHEGLHIPEDHIYIEVIDPDTGLPVPEGEYGELVITPLRQEAMPLIRYRTRDITRIIPGVCPCGRTHRRIERITHRIDDMMIINGVNVFPSQIEECIYKNLTGATNYLIHIKEIKGLKKLKIDIELPDDILNNSEKLKNLNVIMTKSLRSVISVTPELNFVPLYTLPEIKGKAKRVSMD